MTDIAEIIYIYFRLLSDWTTTLIVVCAVCIPLTIFMCVILSKWFRWKCRRKYAHLWHQNKVSSDSSFVVGFFHPYCNAGGGGERVLWTAIGALQKRYSNVRCIIYTGDIDVTREHILHKARNQFNIVLPRSDNLNIDFVFLYQRRWVEAVSYPYFTMLGQSLGSVILGFEALYKFVPDIYIDTMGYAFTLPLFKYLGGCKVGCYVHYPTISTDMLDLVSAGRPSYNNASFVTRSPLLSSCKLIYYRIFAYIYGLVGRRADAVMVNSSWTHGHISKLWRVNYKTHIVFPPCDVSEFLDIMNDNKKLIVPRQILSIGQFRPEKDHRLQINSFELFLSDLPVDKKSEYKLILAGSVRNEDDSARVEELRALCCQLHIEKFVDFKVNISFNEMKQLLAKATIGLHTMWNEHFGIGVVECMAAGTIVLAHNSGGPKMDIVVVKNGQPTGFLASDVESYAKAMSDIFELSPETKDEICANAREHIKIFSVETFEQNFLAVWEKHFTLSDLK